MQAKEWLRNEDTDCYQERVARLEWLISKSPDQVTWLFHGGLLSKYLFEEARYCFVYGQFLSTIILGFSFIEHTLASLFYAAGQDKMERTRAIVLFRKALEQHLINKEEFNHLDRIREFRNPIVHFRRPGDEDRIEYKSVLQSEHPYDLLEEEAQFVMRIILRLLGKFSEIV